MDFVVFLIRRRFAEHVSSVAMVEDNFYLNDNARSYDISAHNDGREETADAIVSAMVEMVQDEKYSNASYSLCFIYDPCNYGPPKINVRFTIGQSIASSSSSTIPSKL